MRRRRRSEKTIRRRGETCVHVDEHESMHALAEMDRTGQDRTYQSVHVFHAHLEASVSVVHQNSIIGSLRDSESHRFFGHGKQPIVDGRVVFGNGQGQRDEELVEEERKSEKSDPCNEKDCAASVVQTAVVARHCCCFFVFPAHQR